MSGSNIANHLGVFDTKGVPNEDFMPRARRGAAGWYDNNTKEIWLFSGFFLYSSGMWLNYLDSTDHISDQGCDMIRLYKRFVEVSSE